MQTKLTFGKHQGKTVGELVFTQPGYISWILDKPDCVVHKSIINKIKVVNLFVIVALFSLSCVASAGTFLFKKNEAVGCGVVQKIQPLNQQPIFDEGAMPKWMANNGHLVNSSGQLFQMLQIFPGLGLVASGLAEVAVDAAINSGKSEKLATKMKAGEIDLKVKPDANGNYKDVEAVTFKMQNGLVINLPLQKNMGMMTLKEGSVVLLSYSKITGTLQRDMLRRNSRIQEYLDSEECSLSKSIYTKEQADEILRANVNLVDESKIIGQ